MTEREKFAYTAGLVDGEGYVSLLRAYRTEHQYTPVVKVSSCDPYMTVFLHTNYGGHLDKPRSPKNKRHSPSTQWTLRNGKNVHEFLSKIYPYLIVKKQHARIVMDYTERYSQASPRNKKVWDEKDEFYRQIRLLTRRGIAPAETE